jgi:hypothetical protein
LGQHQQSGTEYALKDAIKCSETPVVIYLEKYRKAKTARTALQEDRAWIKAKVMAAVSTMSCLERACEPSTRRYADLRHIDLGSDIARIQALVTQF